MSLIKTRAFGTVAPDAPLKLMNIERREVSPRDVEIEIMYCGICHSDLHQAKSDWQGTVYPCVPGHEIVGKVTRVGKDVTRYKAGDAVGVGCMVDSCMTCSPCNAGLEQFCDDGCIYTYNSRDKHSGNHTLGGYSERVVVDEHFVLRLPENLDPAAAAPLLCAGITTYSPLKKWGAGPGKKVGVMGIGGLGHMAVKIAKAMGAHVVVITTSPAKAEDAKRLGADDVVVSTDKAQMRRLRKGLDLIIDTVSARHDINSYLQLLTLDGTLAIVGLPGEPLEVSAFSLVGMRRNFTGSSIGGIPETQEMLDFCAKHNITADIELIDIQHINEAWERLMKGDVRYRFVIDMESIKKLH